MTFGTNSSERANGVLGRLGLTLATPTEIVEARAIAARTVGPQVATTSALQAIQDRTACSTFVYRGTETEISGVICIIPLGRAAQPILAAGDFDGRTPPLGMAARPGEPVVAVYGWGMAGTTFRGRAVAMAGVLSIHREIFDSVPMFSRAATRGGERTLLGRMDGRPVPGPGGLVVCPAWNIQRKAA